VETRMRGFGAEVDRAICPSTVTGRSCGASFAPIGALHKKNFLSTSVSSRLFTMPENEAKRCFMPSLSYCSNKTLKPNMSHCDKLSDIFYVHPREYFPGTSSL
jgi:hypothetical protein